MLSKLASTRAAARQGFERPGLEFGTDTVEVVHVANSAIHAGTRQKGSVWRGSGLAAN